MDCILQDDRVYYKLKKSGMYRYVVAYWDEGKQGILRRSIAYWDVQIRGLVILSNSLHSQERKRTTETVH